MQADIVEEPGGEFRKTDLSPARVALRRGDDQTKTVPPSTTTTWPVLKPSCIKNK